MRNLIGSVIIIFITVATSLAGTTGKISGRATDVETGEPLIGANVIVVGTDFGSATDIDGYYTILKVAPGTYTISATMIGYTEVQVEGLEVSTDFTTTQHFQLMPRALELGEEVIVIGRRPEIQRDRTSTLAVVSSREIERLPVKELSELIDLQAGVVEGHFRGGRIGEVAYQVDGISVSDPYNGEMAVRVENSAIEEVKVISGTFSAEYGQALSGVVNVVTKTGGKQFRVATDLYSGDYLSNNSPPFLNIEDFKPTDIWNGEFSIAGPLPLVRNTSFIVSGRQFESEGYLYGVEEFLPQDSSNLDDPNPENWYIERTGRGIYIPMNPYKKSTIQGKISTKLTSQLSLDVQGNYHRSNWRNYDHLFKYNPHGLPTQYQNGYQLATVITHAPSPRFFYTINLTRYHTNYESYVYKNPYDSRYVSPQFLHRLGYGFFTGGMNTNHFYRSSTVDAFKFNLTGQPHRVHQLKTGLEFRRSNVWLHEFSLRIDRTTNWEPQIFPPESVNNNQYEHTPYEFGAWVEDKIEVSNIILSVGLRFDYFEPGGLVPNDFRDPDGSYKSSDNPFREATPKTQWSPRLGISYPITDQGAIHVSYGHFFQIPNFQYLYHNSEFEVAPGGLYTIMGNADFKPTKTVIYQLGLQQMLIPDLILDVTGYYKDMRNLVGTQVYELYILGDSYARYENRDYGNVRGIAISLTQRPISWFAGSVDYTYQIAEGNASDPLAVFYDRQSDPPRESEIQVVPLDWDQRHTLNFTLSVLLRGWGIGLIGKYGSGLPYTPEYQNQRTAFENSERKPESITLDLKIYYDFKISDLGVSFYAQIKNLLDVKNAISVFNDTGSPQYSLIPTYVPEQPIHSLGDFLTHPDFYSSPRQVIVGLKLNL